MTVAKPRFSTFEAYLNYDDGMDNRYELINGELVELPPEAEQNSAIALVSVGSVDECRCFTSSHQAL